MEACKVENNTPRGSFWMYVFRFEDGTYPDSTMWFLPRPCQHCDNAPCVKVCPVGARYKREDGIVATDWERCIGCRYCETACPYGVNYFNWTDPNDDQYLDAGAEGGVLPYRNPDLEGPHGPEQRRIAGSAHLQGVIDKCTFCVQRVEQGLDPACVTVCPLRALVFGDLDDPDSAVSRTLVRRHSFRLLEEAGTEPRVFYIGGEPPGPGVRETQAEAVKTEV